MEKLKQRIASHTYEKLLNSNVHSLSEILIKGEIHFCQNTEFTPEEIKLLFSAVVDVSLKNKFVSASEIPPWPCLTTGCVAIDAIMNGGIPINGITEIVGPSGVGKTQLCLQLALMVQLPNALGGLNKGAVYICTEDRFPSKRIHQLTEMLPIEYNVNSSNFMDNIFLEHISDYEQLRRCCMVRLPRLLTKHKIGLIVIDSIAGVFRSENLGVNYVARSQEFYTISSSLKKLSSDYGIAIITTNQVVDNINIGKSEACLGLAWSNLVTCRFSISRCVENVRLFEIVFAPDLPHANCKFTIEMVGIRDA